MYFCIVSSDFPILAIIDFCFVNNFFSKTSLVRPHFDDVSIDYDAANLTGLFRFSFVFQLIQE